MPKLILNPVTVNAIDKTVKSPEQPILLTGQTGIGKGSIAVYASEKILETNDFESFPYKMHLKPEKNTIGIESVREIEQFLKLKVPTSQAFNRAIIIEDAHDLTIEAQNALLKTLEEPPLGTVIILTASNQQALLPTVRSRTQIVDVKRPEQQQLADHFNAGGHDSKQIEQSFFISGGLPGLMTSLLEESEHPLIQATETARRLLQASSYERLLMVDELSRQKQLALDTAFILRQMAHVSLQRASGPAAKRWQAVLEAAFSASNALLRSAQPKLALTELALAL